MGESYVEINVAATAESAEAVADFLFGEGALGLITEDVPGDPPGIWIRASFAGAAPVASIVERLSRYQKALGALGVASTDARIEVREVPVEDWSKTWKSHFGPLRIGRRLLIAPSWERATIPAEGRHAIWIDPSMSFGTGHHATTRMCLEALEDVMGEGRGSRKPRVLDIGTGTGILAIAAVLLGADQVVALDTDGEACTAAARNLAINDVAPCVRLVAGSAGALSPGVRFDLIVANLDTTALSPLIPTLHMLLAPQGRLIVSGIMVEAEGRLQGIFRATGLQAMSRRSDGEWLCLTMGRGEG